MLIEDLFDASGAETGEFKLDLTTFDLPVVVATTINIFCAFEDGKYIVKVTDHGDGVKPDDLEKIFTPFFRADNEFVRSVPGAGLGRTISRSIIELHDGSISIESKLGACTTITFTIPGFPNE